MAATTAVPSITSTARPRTEPPELQITPPVGFNLFVIQGLTGDSLGYIARVTLPYLVIMILFTLLILTAELSLRARRTESTPAA